MKKARILLYFAGALPALLAALFVLGTESGFRTWTAAVLLTVFAACFDTATILGFFQKKRQGDPLLAWSCWNLGFAAGITVPTIQAWVKILR